MNTLPVELILAIINYMDATSYLNFRVTNIFYNNILGKDEIENRLRESFKLSLKSINIFGTSHYIVPKMVLKSLSLDIDCEYIYCAICGHLIIESNKILLKGLSHPYMGCPYYAIIWNNNDINKYTMEHNGGPFQKIKCKYCDKVIFRYQNDHHNGKLCTGGD
jgi:hypothetical protein